MTNNTAQQQIVTFSDHRHTHYHLSGCGPLRPLTEQQARQLRQANVPIDLPVTAPLQPQANQSEAE